MVQRNHSNSDVSSFIDSPLDDTSHTVESTTPEPIESSPTNTCCSSSPSNRIVQVLTPTRYRTRRFSYYSNISQDEEAPVLVGEFYLRKTPSESNHFYKYKPKRTAIPLIYKGILHGRDIQQRALKEIGDLVPARSREPSHSSKPTTVEITSPKSLTQHISLLSLKDLMPTTDVYYFGQPLTDDEYSSAEEVVEFMRVVDAGTQVDSSYAQDTRPKSRSKSSRENSYRNESLRFVETRSKLHQRSFRRISQRRSNIQTQQFPERSSQEESQAIPQRRSKLKPKPITDDQDSIKNAETSSKTTSLDIEAIYTRNPHESPAPFQPFPGEQVDRRRTSKTKKNKEKLVEQKKPTFFSRLFNFFRSSSEADGKNKNKKSRKTKNSKKKKKTRKNR